MLVVVNREHGGKENLEKLGYKIHALSKITDIVDSLHIPSISQKKKQTRLLITLGALRIEQ